METAKRRSSSGDATRAEQGRSSELPAAELLKVLRAFRKGDFSVRLSLAHTGTAGEIALAFNDAIETNERMARELRRLSIVVGKEGKLGQRASLGDVSGAWASCVDSVNGLSTISFIRRPRSGASSAR